MSEKQIFLEAKHLSLEFPVGSKVKAGPAKAVGGQFLLDGDKRYVMAVNDVSFKLEAGDTLGLIGHNGSGKTTLLRMLAGIFQPTRGSVVHQGTLGNAINVNLGFRVEASGRHNIRLKSIMAGTKPSLFERIVEDVEEFAQLGAFLDMPMRTYSQGMKARLAFGIATAFRHDILLLDEWLGAGDKAMEKQAAARMADFVAHSKITVLASHRTPLLKKWCNKGLVMDSGEAAFFGPIDKAALFYSDMLKKKAAVADQSGG